jgi:ABC-2 type transport system ATP-binding protein
LGRDDPAIQADQVNANRPALSVENLSFSYGSKQALSDVSFEVYPGLATMLLGLNGSGKTTLFSLLTRLFVPRDGRIEIGGQPLAVAGSKALRNIGIVFQQTTLDLDLTVEQNLRYFAALQGISRGRVEARIEEELRDLDLSSRRKDRVRKLNGGHRRRLEIARALLHRPSLLLLDEPTVGLDVDTRAELVDKLHNLARQDGLAILWATHLIDEIRDDDALIILHEGHIAARGRTDDLVARSGKADLTAAFAHYRSRIQ